MRAPVLLLLGLGALGIPAGVARAADDITAAVAANLAPVLEEARRLYEAETGTRITLVFGATGNLARQIEQGAPYHVFLSADESWMTRLIEQGAIVRESVRPFAEGRLVLLLGREFSRTSALPPGAAPLDAAQLKSTAFALLRSPPIRYLALANPRTAPFGRAAQQALERAGLLSALEPKLVFAENIRQAVQFVESGNADAALSAQSLVLDLSLPWRAVDPSLYDPLPQTLGIVKGAPAAAGHFADWLLSARGQALAARFGYGPAQPAMVDRSR